MSEPVICPACQRSNPSEAVFCENTACHKALGGFRYVAEELAARERWYHRLADRVAAWVGTPHFIVVHALWFAVWVVINTGLLAVGTAFDGYPFDLLAVLMGIEAIFITGLLLISNNRQTLHADLRAELDYEVGVKTYRTVRDLERAVQHMAHRLEHLEADLARPRARPE